MSAYQERAATAVYVQKLVKKDSPIQEQDAVYLRSYKKINPEELKTYVKEHPDACQKEIAKKFKCTSEAVRKALKRLKITQKKDCTL